jgi:hypothetical protein
MVAATFMHGGLSPIAWSTWVGLNPLKDMHHATYFAIGFVQLFSFVWFNMDLSSIRCHQWNEFPSPRVAASTPNIPYRFNEGGVKCSPHSPARIEMVGGSFRKLAHLHFSTQH